MKVTIADAARRDIEEILFWSLENFGDLVCQRYEILLTQALLDLSKNPERLGSKVRLELGQGVRNFHISLSKDNVKSKVGKVKHPRHFLVYRIRSTEHLEIARVLHDSMDLARHKS